MEGWGPSPGFLASSAYPPVVLEELAEVCRDSCRNPTVTAGLVHLRVSVCVSVPIPPRPLMAQAAPSGHTLR